MPSDPQPWYALGCTTLWAQPRLGSPGHAAGKGSAHPPAQQGHSQGCSGMTSFSGHQMLLTSFARGRSHPVDSRGSAGTCHITAGSSSWMCYKWPHKSIETRREICTIPTPTNFFLLLFLREISVLYSHHELAQSSIAVTTKPPGH